MNKTFSSLIKIAVIAIFTIGGTFAQESKLVNDFEGTFDGANPFGGYWYLYGTATIANLGEVTSSLGPGSNDSGQGLVLDFSYDPTSDTSFAGVGTHLEGNNPVINLTGATAITFNAKASVPVNLAFKVVTEAVTNAADHGAHEKVISLGTTWQKYTVNLVEGPGNLVRPYGTPIAFNLGYVQNINFAVSPKDNPVVVDTSYDTTAVPDTAIAIDTTITANYDTTSIDTNINNDTTITVVVDTTAWDTVVVVTDTTITPILDTTSIDTAVAVDTAITFNVDTLAADTTIASDTTITNSNSIDTTVTTGDTLKAAVITIDDITIENYINQPLSIQTDQKIRSGLWASFKGREVTIRYMHPNKNSYRGTMNLYDLQGHKVYSSEVQGKGGILNQVNISTDQVQQGMYLLQLNTKNSKGKIHESQIKIMVTK